MEKIKAYFDKISNLIGEMAYKHLKLEKVRDYVMRLSDRDRQIVIVSLVAFAVLVLIGTYSLISHSLSKKELALSSEKNDYDRIIELRGQYQTYSETLRKIESTINRTGADFSLAAHLENLAKDNGISIESMRPKAATPNDYYKETQVEVKIKEVVLKTIVNFLFQIENSNEFMKIMSIQLRPSYAKPMYLDVTFSVSTFSPV